MRLERRARPLVGPSLVSMIDVLMIMLIFFMVTSTYLNLRMMPLTQGAAPPGAGVQDAGAGGPAAPEPPLLLRLGADGTTRFRGRALSPQDLPDTLAGFPGRDVVVLPSARAPLQSLVTLSDRLRAAGAGRVAVIRPEGAP